MFFGMRRDLFGVCSFFTLMWCKFSVITLNMQPKNNFFFALTIPEEACPALRLVQEHLPKDGIRYSLTRYFHITLKFLGELDEMQALQVQLKGKEVVERMKFSPEDLEMAFSYVGVFRRNSEPSVIWAGVEMNSVFFDLQRNLEEALEPVGFRRDKKRFRPHITLARVRDVERSTSLETLESLNHLGVKHTSFSVNELSLMQSHLVPGSPAEYEEIKGYSLLG